jgi:hypothetical protein
VECLPFSVLNRRHRTLRDPGLAAVGEGDLGPGGTAVGDCEFQAVVQGGLEGGGVGVAGAFAGFDFIDDEHAVAVVSEGGRDDRESEATFY